jgi:phosphorylcholine metabolism protein LicD
MYELLNNVVDILVEHDIPHYIDCGTLLGCVRENGLLKHDTDVDVTIHLSLWDKLKQIDFQKYGLIKKRQFNGPHKLISVETDRETYCDIYANPAFPVLERRTMNNKEYFIPIESELYLTQLYGNWKVPSGKHADWPRYFYNGLITSNYAKYWDNKFVIQK